MKRMWMAGGVIALVVAVTGTGTFTGTRTLALGNAVAATCDVVLTGGK